MRRGGDSGHSGHAERRQHADAVVRAAAEQHLAEPREVAGGAEQPGVTGHPAHAPCRRVVHVPPQHGRAGTAAGPRQRSARLGRGDPGHQRRRRIEGGVGHGQGLEDPLLRESIEEQPADLFDDFGQQHEVQIAVDEPLAGRRDRRQGNRARNRGPGAFEDLFERQVRSQTGGVRQQMGDGDRLPPLTGEPRQEIGHAVAQPKSPLLDEHHDARGRRDDLGQGREVEHGVDGHRLGRLRRERSRPEGPFVHDLAAVPHDDHGAGKMPVPHGPLDQGRRCVQGVSGRWRPGRSPRGRRATGTPPRTFASTREPRTSRMNGRARIWIILIDLFCWHGYRGVLHDR